MANMSIPAQQRMLGRKARASLMQVSHQASHRFGSRKGQTLVGVWGRLQLRRQKDLETLERLEDGVGAKWVSTLCQHTPKPLPSISQNCHGSPVGKRGDYPNS